MPSDSGEEGFRLLAYATDMQRSIEQAIAPASPRTSRSTVTPVPETGPKPSCPEHGGFGLPLANSAQ